MATAGSSWLERATGVVAAGAATFVCATMIFASGFFSVIGIEFARFFRVDGLSPLFLPTFISLLAAGVLLSAIVLGRYLVGELAAGSTSAPKGNPTFHLRNIRFLGWLAFALYFVFALFMPLRWSGWTVSFLLVIISAIDDQSYWTSVRDGTPRRNMSWVPLVLLAAAFCFNLGQRHAFAEIASATKFCAHIPIKGGYFDGVVLLASDDGFLGFDASNLAFVQIDKTGHTLERRPFDRSRSLVSSAENPSEREKMLSGFSCLANSRSSSVSFWQ